MNNYLLFFFSPPLLSQGTIITISNMSDATCQALKSHDIPAYLAQLYYFHIVGVPKILNEEAAISKATIYYNSKSLADLGNRLTVFLDEARKDTVQQQTLTVALKYQDPTRVHARSETETAKVRIYLFYFPAVRGVEVR